MVSLGVEFEDVSAIDQPTKEMESLRDIGLWDPEAPGPNLFLNEYPFLVNGYSPTKYRPLAWTSFGGPGGVYLRSLTGIVVTLGRLDSPNPLHFTYDTKAIPKQSGKPGGCNRPYYGRRVHFPIDGPGGEIIEAVEIILQSAIVRSNSGETGSLMGFKVTKMFFRFILFLEVFDLLPIDLYKSRETLLFPTAATTPPTTTSSIL